MLNLNALMLSDESSHHKCVSDRGVEGLVAAALVIIYVFANDFPVRKFEGLLSKDFIGISKTIENEPGLVSLERYKKPRLYTYS